MFGRINFKSVCSQYHRVKRQRPCSICGKPDWCSYTADEQISFCARISDGADRVSRTGWGVYFHDPTRSKNSPLPFPVKSPKTKIEPADIEIRDFAYRKLIELSPVHRSQEIIDGEHGLRKRKIFDWENYGLLPTSLEERNFLARRIRQEINCKFPNFTRSHQTGLMGLPGFWIDKNGRSRLWTESFSTNEMLLIPFRDNNGLIQACQIRLMGKISDRAQRYCWLSTPEKSNDLSCGSPLHFVRKISPNCPKPVWVTEGALKAETAQTFLSHVNLIALASVSSSSDKLIEFVRYRPLRIVFDIDYHCNKHVARQLGNLINKRLVDSRIYGYEADIKVLVCSPNRKGIDDALIYKETLSELSPIEWFHSLGTEIRRQVHKSIPCFPVVNPPL